MMRALEEEEEEEEGAVMVLVWNQEGGRKGRTFLGTRQRRNECTRL